MPDIRNLPFIQNIISRLQGVESRLAPVESVQATTAATSANALSVAQQALAASGGSNASTLNGQPGAYYLSFANGTNRPTTLVGYGITDAQPLDSDLTAIAALATTSFGRNQLTLADAAGGRTAFQLGTAATLNTGSTSGTIPLIGANGKLAAALMPAVAITDTFVVASQSEQVALAAERGDVAIRTDLNKSFILRTDDPTVFANWQELLAPTGGGGSTGTVTSVSVVTANGVSGTVQNASTTPAITLALGAITPSSVAATGNVTGANLSGTNTGDQTTITGNAGTATKLQTARAINGVNFDGTAAITVADATKQPLTTPYLTPASTASAAGLRVPPGTAPSSPANGDVWTTAAGIYVQINGTTVGPLSAGSGTTLREQDYTLVDQAGNPQTCFWRAGASAQTVSIFAYNRSLQYQVNGGTAVSVSANTSVTNVSIPANGNLEMNSLDPAPNAYAKVKQNA